MKSVPILMYHRVDQIKNDRNTVLPEMFSQHLHFLKKHGYNTITLAQLYDYHTQKIPLPAKPLVLTFDDGYENNFIYALPLLLEHKMQATVFVITGWVGKMNEWENYSGKPSCKMMNWEQLKKWQQAGMEIGAHTVTHPSLSRLKEKEIEWELETSKKQLEENLKIKVKFLCYPYGDFDWRVKKIAQKVGYHGAVAIFQGVSLQKEDIWALPRVVISCRQPLWEFGLKVSPIHREFIRLRILEKQVNKLFSKKDKSKGVEKWQKF